MPERLNALDASFLYLEKPHLHMHVGGLAVFDPSDSPQGPLTIERLRDLIGEKKPGDSVDLEIYRGTKKLTVSVKLGRQPSTPP